MEMLLTNLSDLSGNPVAWAIAALAAVKTLISFVLLQRCPIHRGTREISETEARAAAATRGKPPLSHLLLVLFGMGLAVAGLYMLADRFYGGLALGAMVVGTFIFMTEPSRLVVVRAQNAVFTATLKGGEALAVARESLKDAYAQRMSMELAITVTVFAALYFF